MVNRTLEPQLLPGVAPIGPITPPAPPSGDLTHTSAFRDEVRVLRLEAVS